MNASMKHILPVSFLLLLLAVFTTNIYSQTFSFSDDFSGDLSAWEDKLGNTWSIENEELAGNYSITCGSSTCPHGDLILKDEYQLRDNWKASIDFIRVVDVSHSTYYTAMAGFSVWSDKDKKIMLRIGGGGWESWGGSQDSVSIRVGEWDGSWETALRLKLPYQWNPDEWHTGSVVKNGKNYKFYIDGLLLTEYTDNFLNGEGSVGLHTYGTKRLDNFILEPASKNPTDGLVAYYPFNGNAQDESGNGYHGTEHGNPILTTDRFGNTNSAYSFDGNNDVIAVGDAPALSLTESITLAVWMRPDNVTPSTQMGISGKGNSTFRNYGLFIQTDSRPLWRVEGAAPHLLEGTTRFQTDQWYFIVGVYEKEQNLKIYVNGVLDAQVSASGTPFTSTSGFAIGCQGDNSCYNYSTPFYGDIDDVRLFDRALTAQEIQDIYTLDDSVSTSSNSYRITAATYSETEDLDAVVKRLLGSNASLANWDDIKLMINSGTKSLAEFYQLIGLEDGEDLMVSMGGVCFYSGNRQYYMQRFDDGPYSSFLVHDQIGSLYLGSWYGLNMNILARTYNDTSSYRLSALTYSETTDLDSLAKNLFDSGASLADWTDIKTMHGGDTAKLAEFYEQIGLADKEEAIVSKDGNRFYSSTRQYYMQRFDDGPYSSFLVHDRIGSLYLGSWYGLNMNILAKTKNNTLSVDDKLSIIPEKISLHQNYPNPFNPETNISFQLPEVTDIILKIYNIKGQVINTLVNTRLNAGYYNIVWNGKDNNGKEVAGGIYFYSIRAINNDSKTFCLNKKMILLK